MALELKKTGWTVEEYLALGEEVKAELIRGELHLTPAPGFRHAEVIRVLLESLVMWRHQGPPTDLKSYAGPLDVFLGPDHVLQPDLLVLGPGAAGRPSKRGVEGPPLLVIEVESPSSTKRDALIKRRLYAEAGVPEYWFVRPDGRRVEVFTQASGDNYPTPVLFEDGATLSSALLPGFALAIGELFGPLREDELSLDA